MERIAVEGEHRYIEKTGEREKTRERGKDKGGLESERKSEEGERKSTERERERENKEGTEKERGERNSERDGGARKRAIDRVAK